MQVLATKPIEVGPIDSSKSHVKRYRAIISDGKHHFDFAMFLLFDNMFEDQEVPENNSIIKVMNPNETSTAQNDFRQNSIKHMNEKLVWIICRFDILRKGGEKIGQTMKIQPKQQLIKEQESTPQQSQKDLNLVSRQHTPVKRHESTEEPEASSVKRALFSTLPTKPNPLANSSLYKPSHKIKDLNPYQNKFRIKARVIRKSQLKHWSNSRGEGQVFDIILQDSSGEIKATGILRFFTDCFDPLRNLNKIEAAFRILTPYFFFYTGFNEVAEKLYTVFEENKVYILESAQIKPIQNRTYNTTDHNYELTLNNSTKAQEIGEACSKDVPTTLYSFVKISDLSNKQEKEKVDVLGVILEVQDTQDILTRTGRRTRKREIQIIDSSSCKINVTLWGDKAEHFPTDALYKIFALKGAEISEWQGKSLNCGFTSTYEIDPTNCEEAEVLRAWFEREENYTSTQSLSNKSFGLTSNSGNSELTTLAEVKESSYANVVADSVKYYTVEASLITIKPDNVMYRACPNESCRRKVTEEPLNSGEFKCQKCDKKYPNFAWRYSLQAAIADFTDNHWVTVFEESGSQILGVSADQLAQKKEQNRVEFEKILSDCKYALFELTLKSKLETWNDEKRLQLSVVKALKVDRSGGNRITRLKTQIDHINYS